jgi:hypothetical protein
MGPHYLVWVTSMHCGGYVDPRAVMNGASVRIGIQAVQTTF